MIKKVFVDTNILIDFLGDRMPFADAAEELVLMAEAKTIEVYVSPLSFDNIYYILSHQFSHTQLMKMFDQLLRHIKVLNTNKEVVQKAVMSDFVDFEDAIQYFSLIKEKGISTIITRDRKGFRKGKLSVMTAEEYLKQLN